MGIQTVQFLHLGLATNTNKFFGTKFELKLILSLIDTLENEFAC